MEASISIEFESLSELGSPVSSADESETDNIIIIYNNNENNNENNHIILLRIIANKVRI